MALIVAMLVIIMMSSMAAVVYMPGASAKFGMGPISSLSFHTFKVVRMLSSGRELALYRARAGMVDAQERMRTNYLTLDSGGPLTTWANIGSLAAPKYNFIINNYSVCQQVKTTLRDDYAYVAAGVPDSVPTSGTYGCRLITVTGQEFFQTN